MKDKRTFPKWPILLISVLTLLAIPTSSLGATFCVSDATELQTALTTAESNGQDNTIQIVQGTYNGNFTYASTEAYGLTVEGGYTQDCASRTIAPTNTILDGGGTDMVLALVSQGSATFSIEGLTFQNGKTSTADKGGGLYAKTVNGTVTLTNNTFTGNTANFGGGAFVEGSSSTLINNSFTDNTASVHTGGGVFVSGSGTLTNNTFTGNTAGTGGGVFVEGRSTLTNNTFTGNTASVNGGGVSVGGGILTNNTFTDNTASGNGGGVSFWSSSSTLTNNTFTGNTANYGGGSYFGGSDFPSIGRIIIILTNNTLTSNTAETEGGGVWLKLYHSSGTGNLYNNIIWNNTAPDGDDLYIDITGSEPFFPATVNLFNNDFD